MSFYFDDFDDDGGDTPATPFASQSQSQSGEQEFLCSNCGGGESYEDEAGVLCCTNCFTLSQDVAYEKESTLNFDDIMAVAARTRGGQIMTTKKKKARGGPSKRKPRQPLEELDTSKPLPDLKLCIHGFTATLKGGIESVSAIMRLSTNEQQALMESAKSIFLTYLRAWRDGAEKYGAVYPDMRFSLRDSFLSETYVDAIIRVLSYKVAKMTGKEIKKKETEGDNNNDDDSTNKRLDNTNDSDSDHDANEEHDPSTLPERKETSKKKDESSHDYEGRPEVHSADDLQNFTQETRGKKRQFDTVGEFINGQNENRVLGRETAALALHPGMEFATAIIWFVIARIGVTPGQLCSWIANGSLPFLNAFERLLSTEEQESLKFVHIAFKMSEPPDPARIEKLAAFLAVACDMKASKDIPQYRVFMESNDPAEESGTNLRVQKVLDRIRFVPVDCVPLMVGQLVADLRLGQRVLDIALSLIGKKPVNTTGWLPAPLERTHPGRVSTPEHALAVIAVACKMCPGWESWSYVKVPPKKDRHGAKSEAHQRFVPWNEEQFNLLDDENISDYLDFIEDIVIVKEDKDAHPSIQKIASLFEKDCEEIVPADDSAPVAQSGDAEIRKKPPKGEVLLRGVSNDKHKELLNRRPKNYLPYLSYPEPETHTSIAGKELKLTPEPFHSYYTRLIEYMAYKIRVAPHRIHAFVAYIDEEIVALCDFGSFDDPEVKQQRKKERLSQLVRSRKNRRLGWGKLHVEEEKLKRLTEEAAKNKGDVEKQRRLEELKEKIERMRYERENGESLEDSDSNSDSDKDVPLDEFSQNGSSGEEDLGRITAEV